MWRACERAKEQFISSYRFSSRHGFSVVTDFIWVCVLVRASEGEPHGANGSVSFTHFSFAIRYEQQWMQYFVSPFMKWARHVRRWMRRMRLLEESRFAARTLCLWTHVFNSASLPNFSFIYILHFVPIQINHMLLTPNLFESKLFTLLTKISGNSKLKIFNTWDCVLNSFSEELNKLCTWTTYVQCAQVDTASILGARNLCSALKACFTGRIYGIQPTIFLILIFYDIYDFKWDD